MSDGHRCLRCGIKTRMVVSDETAPARLVYALVCPEAGCDNIVWVDQEPSKGESDASHLRGLRRGG